MRNRCCQLCMRQPKKNASNKGNQWFHCDLLNNVSYSRLFFIRQTKKNVEKSNNTTAATVATHVELNQQASKTRRDDFCVGGCKESCLEYKKSQILLPFRENTTDSIFAFWYSEIIMSRAVLLTWLKLTNWKLRFSFTPKYFFRLWSSFDLHYVCIIIKRN